MKLNLISVEINNFLSYGHSKIELSDRGYCLVSGVNRCSRDNATSNGSGKSSWSSAICWALTGQTIQGLKRGIKNIYADKQDDCCVTLIFTVDNDKYEITRYTGGKTGSDLKIKLNDNDVSGKGISESELALERYLPDLTSELIGSVIILGQGLPYKFSNNTPSGRKEVLEKLSKSDFMIEDIKNRINKRYNELSVDLRTNEDNKLSVTSKLDVYKGQLQTLQDKLKELENTVSFDDDIKLYEDKIKVIQDKISSQDTEIDKISQELNGFSEERDAISTEKTNKSSLIYDKYDKIQREKYDKKSTLESKISNLKDEINKLESITDICPVCGQKIPGVLKPDTTKQHEDLKVYSDQLSKIIYEISSDSTAKQDELNKLNEGYDSKIDKINRKINNSKTSRMTIENERRSNNNQLLEHQRSLMSLKTKKESYLNTLNETKDGIKKAEENISNLEKDKTDLEANITSLNTHIDIINKINTLVKRDFRGVLLSNVINFIDKKAKEYSMDIFGTDELSFVLEGNSINITYCNKPFENLSGGEKQKVDLIIQFAIRDMMSQYLDFRCNILVLDEITDNLDEIGCTNVLNLISRKLNDLESIFIVSHRSQELSIPYDSELTVTKNEQGISVIK